MASRVLDKKLKKVLEMRTDTPALLESLEAISTLITDGRDHSGGGGGRGGTGAGVGGEGEEGKGGGGGGHEYSTMDARRSLREDLEKQVLSVVSCYLCQNNVLRKEQRGVRGLEFTTDTRTVELQRYSSGQPVRY